MRAFTRSEAVDLALADAAGAARKKFRREFAAADRIKRAKGWKPWWERISLQRSAAGTGRIPSAKSLANLQLGRRRAS